MIEDKPDAALMRYQVLSLIRLMAAAQVVLGVVVIGGKLGLPYIVGAALVLTGVLEFFLIPRLLAKRWKSDAQ
ncbi:MAG: hypothetical protein RL702_391 [Pseudomonadota bacterium]|jgi:hypothetical protein|nr:hypothetical protein [Novosphingobium sp.]HPB21702.1 hypothetical protein [Novosphingobium sp.]HPZ45710.1 hypothetical protein [Novosphingobium sp.]HQD99517.1 hypothetical protein [Novosphingobium sp.]HQN52903.1 hypothetical protein [Novosphingobium sp.]